jgi:hypothetical protein
MARVGVLEQLAPRLDPLGAKILAAKLHIDLARVAGQDASDVHARMLLLRVRLARIVRRPL